MSLGLSRRRILTGGKVVGYSPLPGDRPQAPRLLSGGQIVEEDQDEGPGLLEAGARGALAGATFDFDDEAGAALGSMFSDRKYTELRDELRAKKAAAQEAHPWGYGLGSILGTVGTGVVTGGASAAGKLGLGVGKVAAIEGGLQAAGASEADLTKGEVGEFAKDTGTGAAIGGVIGAGLHKVLGTYARGAVERRAQHLGQDIADGAVPSVKRRLGTVLEVNEKSGRALAVDVLDSDPQFLKALGKGQSQARVVVQQRLDTLGKEVTPIYKALDLETGGVPLGLVKGKLDDAVNAADQPGNAHIHRALEEARESLLGSYRRQLDLAPGVDLNSVNLPTQDIRKWVTRLKKQATASMGALSETERKEVKDVVHQAANKILNEHLDNVGKSLPSMAGDIAALREANKKILVYELSDGALRNAAGRKAWSPSSFTDTLTKTFLPVAAGAIGAGADVVTGGLAYGGAKVALKLGAKANRGATRLLAGLVKAAKEGKANAELALAAIEGGVPVAVVNTIMSNVGQPLALAGANAAAEAISSAGRRGHGGGGEGDE